MSHLEPDTDTKRQILQQKLRQYRAKAYDFQVTAQVAESLDSEQEAQQARAKSKQLYRAAAETEALLDELPDEEGEGTE